MSASPVRAARLGPGFLIIARIRCIRKTLPGRAPVLEYRGQYFDRAALGAVGGTHRLERSSIRARARTLRGGMWLRSRALTVWGQRGRKPGQASRERQPRFASGVMSREAA